MTDIADRTLKILAGKAVLNGATDPRVVEAAMAAIRAAADTDAQVKAAFQSLIDDTAKSRQAMEAAAAECRECMTRAESAAATVNGDTAAALDTVRAATAALEAALVNERAAGLDREERILVGVTTALSAIREQQQALTILCQQVGNAMAEVSASPPAAPAVTWKFDFRRDELGQLKTITAKPQ